MMSRRLNIKHICSMSLATYILAKSNVIAEILEAERKAQNNNVIIDNAAIYYIIGFAAVLVTIIPGFVLQKREDNIKKNSGLYNDIIKLNSKYIFHKDIPRSYSITHEMKSKQSLERADEIGVIQYILYSDEKLKSVFERLLENNTEYTEYIKECNRIATDHGFDNIDAQKSAEYKLFKRCIQDPKLDIKIDLRLEYNSAKGRNHYWRSFNASYKNLLYADQETSRKEIMQLHAQIERSKMSDALRYKVLTRDGHRCVICGATASDGVKLHVDHILPVSKGGKTEMSNLRTLCERCNLGKSDRYNYDGLN